jgi:probable phosphoglycerate mutase
MLSSPLGRARETADVALFDVGGVIREDAKLAEIGMGRFQGLTRAQILERHPDAFREKDPFFWYNTVPGGEGFDAVELRVASFLRNLRGPAVVVTHGIVSRFLRGLVLGLDRKGMAKLDGGQGVVFHIKNGKHSKLA